MEIVFVFAPIRLLELLKNNLQMEKFTIAEIDDVRNSGFRPQVVGCFINDRKILFLYKKIHDLWQLPQGGIDNGEDIDASFTREMAEELGGKFTASVTSDISLVGSDEIDFPKQTQNSRELKNDKGEIIFMKGKKYFFIAATSDTLEIDIAETEFDDYKWVTHAKALVLCNEMYQQGKKRITLNALSQIKSLGLI